MTSMSSLKNKILGIIVNITVFLAIWAIGCYVVECVAKVRSIPWTMMAGYFIVRFGFWVADCAEDAAKGKKRQRKGG